MGFLLVLAPSMGHRSKPVGDAPTQPLNHCKALKPLKASTGTHAGRHEGALVQDPGLGAGTRTLSPTVGRMGQRLP